MFSSAFAIVLIDTIIPATEDQWGISEAFSVFDHMLSRGMASAMVYHEHLVEMNEFRMSLRPRELPNNVYLASPQIFKNDTIRDPTPLTGGMNMMSQGPQINQMEQDLIWSWMSMENNDLGALHPDTMQSAISGLNSDAMASTLDFDVKNQWLWGNYTQE
jgi:hypothetical protein